jgi:hypothetical protein
MKSKMSSANKPLLVGIIIDVSSSMRRNWKNQDGKHLPQIEVIKDGLNRQMRKAKSIYSNKPETKEVQLFCVGMGFKRPEQAVRFIDLSRNKEKPLDTTATTIIDAGVVYSGKVNSDTKMGKTKVVNCANEKALYRSSES